MEVTANEVLEFWLGPVEQRHAPDPKIKQRWWMKSETLDREIAQRFSGAVEAAGRGELDAWLDDAERCLALILLLDQFTRNIYRNSGAMYAHDAKAQQASQRACQDGYDQQLPPGARLFFYMPLMHAESLKLQDECVRHFEGLSVAHPELAGHLKYATDHRDIVARFGRFPHRNTLLERQSSQEEVAFLKQPGSSF